ncbi:hypothetical protein DPMN_169506 [Dreissena polymorpha]|uniref:Uncharacterized protein n=1 Tax=Dreissena polymorpha TaxID=45954 RepID=A0A9D4DUS9_DREPO|nr:hypothetical protein DPMN_169506 [Dreissena polymorpha]
MNDANVLCRMLHMDLRSLDYYIDGRYGVGRGPIFYLHCSGSEQSTTVPVPNTIRPDAHTPTILA